MAQCRSCGSKDARGIFCGVCGARLEPASAAATPKSSPSPVPAPKISVSPPPAADPPVTSTREASRLDQLTAELKANPGSPAAYLNLGEALFHVGKFDRAYSTFRAARAIAPEDPAILRMGARILDALGRRDEAIDLWDRCLKLSETDIEAGLQVARLLYESGRRREALARLQSWRRQSEQRPELLLRVAEIQLAVGNPADALEDISQYRKLAGNSREAYLLQGRAMMAQNFADGAIGLYKEALTALPDDPDLRWGLGKALLAANERGQAMLEFERASKSAPDRVEILFELGRLSGEAGMEDRAEEVFQRIREANVRSGEIFLDLGRYYLSRRRIDVALRELQRARELSPHHPEIIRTFAEALESKELWPKALSEYEAFLEGAPGTAWALQGLIRCAGKLEAHEVTAKAQKAFIDAGHASPDAWCDLGETLIRLARFPDAEKAFEAAARLDPTHVRAYQAPELIRIEKARAEGRKLVDQARDAIQKRFLLTAIERLERALALVPREHGWMRLLADVYLRIGDLGRGSKLLTQVRAVMPNDYQVGYQLARTYEFEDKSQLAQELLSSVLKDRPDEIDGHLMLLRLKRSQVQGDRFEKDMLASLLRTTRQDLAPVSKQAPVQQIVEGYVHYLFGMGTKMQTESLKQAEELFEEALYRNNESVPAHRGLCLIYRARGDWRKATLHMQELVKTSSDPSALYALARLHENFQHFEEARKCYTSLRSLFPENGLYRRMQILMAAREVEVGSKNPLMDFINSCQETLREDGNHSWVLYDLAWAQTLVARQSPQRDEWAKRALLSWNKAASHPDANEWARWGLGDASIEFSKGAVRQKHLVSHVKTCEKVCREHPDMAIAYAELGRCHLLFDDLAQTDKALTQLETSFFLDPQSMTTAMLLAKAYRALGKPARVDAIRQNVILSEPEIQSKL